MRDLRDPQELGAALLRIAASARPRPFPGSGLSRFADSPVLFGVPDFSSDEGPVERYGDPRKLPSTMP